MGRLGTMVPAQGRETNPMHEQGRLYEHLEADGEHETAQTERKTDAEALTFEQAFSRLEQIVARLEGGEAALEDSLRLFEEGVRLARFCRARLDRTETRIRVLIDGVEGDDGQRIAADLEREIDGDGDGIG